MKDSLERKAAQMSDVVRIVCIGDVVGQPGRQMIHQHLKTLKEEEGIHFAVVNAENAAGGLGLTPRLANGLFHQGADVITLGDHVWDRDDLVPYLDKHDRILRPANFPPGTPGRGHALITTSGGIKIGVINLLGRTFMRYNVECPFRTLDAILESWRDQVKIIIVDFHAETTSEKIALGHYATGRVSAVVGTHTHVQTADETIRDGKTATITDLGMTGPYDSVIGQNKERIIQRFMTQRPVRFEVAQKDPMLCGAIIDCDPRTGHALRIQRLQRRG